MPDQSDASQLAAFGFEMGILKRARRSGWRHAGVRDPESIADHSMRAAQLAALIAAEECADPVRASFLALWHDTQETRTGDLPHTATAYLTKPEPREITADQTAGLPERSREVIRSAVDEYESGETVESRCAADADKLEMLLQARAAGHRTGTSSSMADHIRIHARLRRAIGSACWPLTSRRPRWFDGSSPTIWTGWVIARSPIA